MTNDQRPLEAPEPAPRRWPFTYVQVRLGVLMAALVFGLSGMVRNDPRLIDIGIGVALVGVVMRFLNRKKKGA